MNLARLHPLRAIRSLYTYLTQRVADRRYWLGQSSAGVAVGHETAMALTTFARCVTILAGDISSLDLVLYRRRPDGGKDLAVGHPDWPLWTLAPAPYLTRQRLVECLMGHLLTRGNAYCEVETRGGRPVALHPIDPRSIEVAGMRGDELVYAYAHPTEGLKHVPGRRVLHVRGYSEDGISGISPLKCIRNSLGLAVAQESYGASLFRNGSVPKGILSYPEVLTDEDFEAIRKSWEAQHSGENSSRFAILDRGLKWENTGIAPDEAQFLESRKFQRAEICGWFGIPPYRVGDLERATWANVESLGLDYVTYTLLPWLVRFESEINALFYRTGEYFVAFNFDALTRGDLAARANFYRTLVNLGGLTINEMRHREGLNPIGPVGDVHWMPVNMSPAEDVLTDPDNTQLRGLPMTPELRQAHEEYLTRAKKLREEYLQRMAPHLPLVNPLGQPAAVAG